MIKCKKRGALIVLFVTVIALSVQAMGLNGVKVFAEEDDNTVTLSTELEKITSVDTLTAGDITFYTANSWAGYKRIAVDAANKGEHPQVLLNNVVINNESDLELVHFRGGEDATHTVGVWGEDGGPNRIVSFAYTAKQTGKLYMPETSLQIIESSETAAKGKTFNGALGMYIVKGTAEYKTEDQVWSYYQAGNTYTISEQVFDVVEGDCIFVHFYSKKQDADISQASFVSFKYNPSFVFQAPAASEHAFNHVQKLSLDANGALVNDVRITDDDQTTYPFSYLYRQTGGSASGFAGQEDATAITEMTRAGAGFDPTQKNLYANESYSSFMANGKILTVAVSPDPNNVILGFTSPYDGALTISDIAFKYNYYPNKTNNYEFYGMNVGSAFKGYAFRILLNGKTVWPKEGGYDKSLAKLYEKDTDGYAAGDLIGVQSTDNIENILVKKYDRVYFEITRADLDSPQNCDVIDFSPTFTINTAADMTDYVYYTTASDYFDISNSNDAESVISYWSVDTSAGLYNLAEYKLMAGVDYASLAFTSGILDDDKSEISWNYFRPSAKKDAAISYLAPCSGNLTISAESLFRGGNFTLWEYYDIINNGNLFESDGVRLRIEINGERAWPVDRAWETYRPTSANKGVFNFEDITLGVNAGDRVTVRVNCVNGNLYDGLNFNPVFGIKQTQTPVANPEITVADPVDEETSVPSDSGNGSNLNSSSFGADDNKPSGCGGCKGAIGGVELSILIGAAVALIVKKRKK